MTDSNRTKGASYESGNPSVLLSCDFPEWLSAHGFTVDDSDIAQMLFDTVGFQKLLGYVAFLRSVSTADTCTVAALEALVALDDDLRIIMLDAIRVIELQVKAQYAQGMTECYGLYCLYDNSLFRHKKMHATTMKSLTREVAQYRKECGVAQLKHITIGEAFEYTSLAHVAKLLYNTQSHQVVARVAKSFSVNNRCLHSWLQTLIYVRNACAHFNPYVIRPCIPSIPKPLYGFEEEDCSSPLYALLIIERLLQGRVDACITGAKEVLYAYTHNVIDAVGNFASQYGDTLAAIKVPQRYIVESDIRGSVFLHPYNSWTTYAILQMAA